MTGVPDHVLRNRAAWDRLAADYAGPGLHNWAATEPGWGVWKVPEAQLGILPPDLAGADSLELGCGTGYVSAWLARRGARPVGLDNSAAQLASAAALQDRFGLRFPLIHASAEQIPGRPAAQLALGARMTVRILRWATCCVAGVSVGLLAGGVALSYVDRHLVPTSGWDFSSVFEEVTFMAIPAVGFILASRRPGNRVGWIFLGAGLVLGLGLFLRAVRAARTGRGSRLAAGGPGGRVVRELVRGDSGRGAGVHAPAVPGRAADLAALAPGCVVRGRGVRAVCGGPGGPRLPGMGGPVQPDR
ncbi:MAG TPA: class I SAM-dependent methyltransferase [Streptosporangiaceae bacterium]|nr:class I SAM-dependent methyltransferase [Streptosporangiaceae bacterium]